MAEALELPSPHPPLAAAPCLCPSYPSSQATPRPTNAEIASAPARQTLPVRVPEAAPSQPPLGVAPCLSNPVHYHRLPLAQSTLERLQQLRTYYDGPFLQTVAECRELPAVLLLPDIKVEGCSAAEWLQAVRDSHALLRIAREEQQQQQV